MRWHERPEAATLLAAIRIEQPQPFFIRRDAWSNCLYPKYRGANARALRQLWEQERDAAMTANARAAWLELGHDHPDDVIERVLNEQTVPWTRFEMKELPDGRSQVAA